jgi:hypothetical protein
MRVQTRADSAGELPFVVGRDTSAQSVRLLGYCSCVA